MNDLSFSWQNNNHTASKNMFFRKHLTKHRTKNKIAPKTRAIKKSYKTQTRAINKSYKQKPFFRKPKNKSYKQDKPKSLLPASAALCLGKEPRPVRHWRPKRESLGAVEGRPSVDKRTNFFFFFFGGGGLVSLLKKSNPKR